jgi:hypothetical protein
MVQTLQETFGGFLPKNNIHLPQGPTIPLLENSTSKRNKSIYFYKDSYRNSHSSLFIISSPPSIPMTLYRRMDRLHRIRNPGTLPVKWNRSLNAHTKFTNLKNIVLKEAIHEDAGKKEPSYTVGGNVD